jgi:predicted peroxiredoxin
VDELREIAKQMSRESGIKITLCRFSVREDLEVIDRRH